MQIETGWREHRESLQAAVAEESVPKAVVAAKALLSFERQADVSFCATAFRKLGSALRAAGHKPLRTFLVRSVTVEPILPTLQVEAVLHGYVLDVEVGGYGSYMDELMNPSSVLGRSQADLVCVLLDTEEIAGSLPELCAAGRTEAIGAEIEMAVGRVHQMLASFREHSKGRLLLQGCVLPDTTSLGAVGDANVPHSLLHALRDLNLRLAAACQSVTDCVFFDVDQAAAYHGRHRWRDDRMFLASRLAVAPVAFQPYAHGLLRCASVLFRPARKVLCTDLDNTFWGGVLGEEGPAGIATGATYPGICFLNYQRYLKDLAARGILLAITSKNNEADVAEAFAIRSADLALTLDDFVARKIGWNEKVDALRELAAELSLGLDSLVFVDDNPTECEAVRQHLPEVAVVEVPVREPWRLVPMLSAQWYFDAISVTADDRNRSQEYKAQVQRAALGQNATSREDFLASLGIVCTFLSAADAPLERAVQLLSKTNQFNLTTRRYSAGEVLGFVSDPDCQALAVRVRDRFGDAGVVGLALTRRTGDQCWMDTLLLSCRVIGRGIETAVLAEVAQHAAATGCRWFMGEFIPTKKNAPCQDFYPDHGFDLDESLSKDEARIYRLDLALRVPESPSWLTLEGNRLYELANSTVLSA